ncbi:MAG: 3-dehydroquinate synthase II [bacterium]
MTESSTIWVEVSDYDRDFITGCLEAGVDGIYSSEPIGEKIRELGVVTTITPDGDLVPGDDVASVTIASKSDEESVLKEAAGSDYVIVDSEDWMIIPLENLIAQTDNLLAYVESAEDAQVAVETLEKGVSGVVLGTDDLSEVRSAVERLKQSGETFELQPAEVTAIQQMGLADRVCVDSSTMMEFGQGMLVGNSSGGMFLVHAEVKESEYVASRPFRVNAGGVHAYIRIPGGETKYLSEITAGDEVLVVDEDGEAEPAIVGRSKLERRPMMLIKAELKDGEGEPQEASLLLQNAETINLTRPDGTPVSVVDLRPGDEILTYFEAAGRHFGMQVDETIEER